jgi:hypothetical protein
MSDPDFDGCGYPWTDEPVPALDQGVAEHFARRCLAYDGPDGTPRLCWPARGEQLVRHLGRGPGGDERLPVRLADGQYPRTSQHPQPDRVRSILGGGGSVRSTSGQYDAFHLREQGPRSSLTLHHPDRAPDGVEGPAEVVYVFDGYQAPRRGFGRWSW